MTTLATFMLAESDSGDLLYVIAVVVFGVIGAIVNKIKERGSASTPGRDATEPAPKEEPQPTRPRPVPRPGPVSRPMPLPRPVIRENIPQAPRPATPVPRPAPARPPARPVPKPGPAVGKPVPQRPAARPQAPRPVEVSKPPAPSVPQRQLLREEEEFVQPLAEETVRPVLKPAEALVAARQQPGGILAGIGRTEFRRAIVLNELLGPPLALREDL